MKADDRARREEIIGTLIGLDVISKDKAQKISNIKVLTCLLIAGPLGHSTVLYLIATIAGRFWRNLPIST